MCTAVKDFATSNWQYIKDGISASGREGRAVLRAGPGLWQLPFSPNKINYWILVLELG